MKSLLWVSNSDDEIVEHADWVEAVTLFKADRKASREDLVRAIIQANRIHDTEARKIAEDTFKELSDRIVSCGTNDPSTKACYPFDLNYDKTVLEFTGGELQGPGLIYLFLLTVTRGDMSSSNRRQKNIDPTEVFENLCADVLINFWGGESAYSKGIVFGTARERNPAKQDRKFPDNVNKLCEHLGEGIGWKQRARSPKAGDGGLDVVVWRKFADKRKGGLVAFGQCKTGMHWRNHLGKLKPKAFCGNYFTEQLVIEPLEMYLVPCRINADRWEEDLRRGGLLMDRCRIVQFGMKIKAAILESCKHWMYAVHEQQKQMMSK